MTTKKSQLNNLDGANKHTQNNHPHVDKKQPVLLFLPYTRETPEITIYISERPWIIPQLRFVKCRVKEQNCQTTNIISIRDTDIVLSIKIGRPIQR